MPTVTTKPATASVFFERRAEHIRLALKDVDDRIAEREQAVRYNDRLQRPTAGSIRSELSHYRRERQILRRELNRALFNAGRK